MSPTSTNFISIVEQERIIDEFLGQWNFENDYMTICCYDCCKGEDKCTCQVVQEDTVKEIQAMCEPQQNKGESENVFFVTQEQLHTSNQVDHGMLNDFKMSYNSIESRRQYVSSKNASLSSMCGEWKQSPYYQEWHNECSQQPYPSHILPSPPYLYYILPSSPSTLYTAQILPLSLSNSYNP